MGISDFHPYRVFLVSKRYPYQQPERYSLASLDARTNLHLQGIIITPSKMRVKSNVPN